MKKQLVSVLTVGALTASVLAGCSGSSEEKTSGGKDVLKIWSFTDELKEPSKSSKRKTESKSN